MAANSRGNQNAYVGYAQIVPKNDYGGNKTTPYYQGKDSNLACSRGPQRQILSSISGNGVAIAGDSYGHRNAYVGYAQTVPKNDHYGEKQTTSYNYQVRQGQQSGLYQRTSKTNSMDKQTGKYARVTNKDVFSGGETFKERSTGRVGFKDEYKTTSTYRLGDKSGYCEYQIEERFRMINFGGSGSSNNNSGNYGGPSYQNYGGGNKSKYGSVLHKNTGNKSNYGVGYKNYVGSNKGNYNNYGGWNVNNNGNRGGEWHKNYDGSDGNDRSGSYNGNYNGGSFNYGGQAALKGYSSFQGSNHAEEDEEIGFGADEEYEDYSNVWNYNPYDDIEENGEEFEDYNSGLYDDGKEEDEEGFEGSYDEEGCKDYTTTFEHEDVNDGNGDEDYYCDCGGYDYPDDYPDDYADAYVDFDTDYD
ncbi:hypothetical protein CCACVL1_07098 [Corchorus capsularis]|uniref:Uncharacterized protein n=1 Tax=Corchorus capsularis TaxID=210143 RepID=A0A1R3J9H2_COCAP|nr:hypothetical protein CCACVL1_07098 [Corchorus capsularis]